MEAQVTVIAESELHGAGGDARKQKQENGYKRRGLGMALADPFFAIWLHEWDDALSYGERRSQDGNSLRDGRA